LLEALNISKSEFSSNTMTQHVLCNVVESEQSMMRRKEDEEKEEQLRLERLRIEKEKKERREKRIAEIALKANCWELDKYSQFLNVPLQRDPQRDKHIQGDRQGVDQDDGGQIVENTGSLDQWCSIRFGTVILPSFNKFFYSIKVLSLPSTTNTWKICIGAVPIEFNIEADRHWIGSQHSWSYIAGTGGKCNNSGKSVNYGEKYKEGDVVSVLLDFDNGTIEFFKNGKSQGVAFKGLKAAVIPAVSLTSKGCRLKMLDLVNEKHLPSRYKPFMVKNVEIMRNYTKQRQHYLSSDFEKEQNEIWNRSNDHRVNMLYPRFSSYRHPPSLHFKSTVVRGHCHEDSICNVVVNNGSGDKWRMARSFGAYYPDEEQTEVDVAAFEFDIIRDGKSSNTWRLCVGVVPIDFDSGSDKIWVGAQSSWSYIAGTGGKCFNSAQSNSYGERYSTGDKIAIVLDFKALSIEFFKNGESQGVAFKDCEALKSGVYGACSMTGSTTTIMFNSLSPSRALQLRMGGEQKREMLQNVMEEFGNIWDSKKMTKGGLKVIDSMSVCSDWNPKAQDKDPWKCAASLLPYQTGRRYFEMELVSLPKSSSNKWKICIGVIPKSFNVNHSKHKLWIGAQGSWSLLVGVGGKCHGSTKSTQYTNESFAAKDRIGVLMDFDNHTLEFYKNDRSLGEAFNNLYGPVFAAVSIAVNHCIVRFRPEAESLNMERLFLFS